LLDPAASARDRDPVAAEALFRAGRDALKRGAWAAACSKLAESQTLDPAAGTALNLAVCQEKLGNVARPCRRRRRRPLRPRRLRWIHWIGAADARYLRGTGA
jgi:hypothetical protein